MYDRMAATFGAAALALAFLAPAVCAGNAAPLRVCADPDNLPFSNAAGEGFENRLAQLIAAALRQPLAYVWTRRTGSARDVLNAGGCDVVMGIPSQFDAVTTTAPYYWSSYVFVTRADRRLDISSLKDHRLRDLKIALPSVDGDRLYSPPAQALAEAGLTVNLVGYPVDGAGDKGAQRARIVEAVAKGDADIAAVWGPLAGYFMRHSPVPLTMTAIGDTDQFSSRKAHFALLGLQYEIAMGVRQGDDHLRRVLDRVIAAEQPEIDALLESFGVPLIVPARLSAAAPSTAGAD